MIQHLVLLRFNETTSIEQQAAVAASFAALRQRIPFLQHLEWGTNVSPEGLAKGFTHCFFLSFASVADRDAYLPHPEHQAFVALLKPHLADVLVIDYAPSVA